MSRYRRAVTGTTSFFTVVSYLDEVTSKSRQKHRDASMWQRRFWEHQIRSEPDFEKHLNYIHFNPVKHGVVCSAAERQYSTFLRYVKEGVYPLDWGGEPYLASLDLE